MQAYYHDNINIMKIIINHEQEQIRGGACWHARRHAQNEKLKKRNNRERRTLITGRTLFRKTRQRVKKEDERKRQISGPPSRPSCGVENGEKKGEGGENIALEPSRPRDNEVRQRPPSVTDTVVKVVLRDHDGISAL